MPPGPVYHVVHMGKQLPSQGRSFQQIAHKTVNSLVGAAVGADGHADGTAGADLAPIVETSLIVELPLPDTIIDDLVTHGDRF